MLLLIRFTLNIFTNPKKTTREHTNDDTFPCSSYGEFVFWMFLRFWKTIFCLNSCAKKLKLFFWNRVLEAGSERKQLTLSHFSSFWHTSFWRFLGDKYKFFFNHFGNRKIMFCVYSMFTRTFCPNFHEIFVKFLQKKLVFCQNE